MAQRGEKSGERERPGEWRRKDLLGLEELSAAEIMLILERARFFKEEALGHGRKLTRLHGKTVVNFFYEPSTRTRLSFELAAKRLGADVVNIEVATSSVVKGESLRDSARTLEALGADVVVVRHSVAGVPQLLAQTVGAAVINAGDGAHEHPTQALLDLYTLWEYKGEFAALKVVILGDILYSRVARSNIWGLRKLGARVVVAGPATLLPPGLDKLGVEVTTDVAAALEGADAVNVLRIQLERQKKGLFPSLEEYARFFALTRERLALAKPDALVMHPGPTNPGIEIAQEVALGTQAVIRRQVSNGVAVRMALLDLLAGGEEDVNADA